MRPSNAALALAVLGALAGTTAAAAPPASFTDTLVASIGAPTALAFTPDGRLLITTQGGALRVFQGSLLATPALTIGSICTNSERGLLGVAVDPAFATNQYIYLYYTANIGGVGCKNRVSRFTLPGSNVINPASELILIDRIHSTAGNHNAGDLHFGKDGYLYVSVGDGGCDYKTPSSGCAGANNASRDRNVLLGKILRIASDGSIPPTNPFTGAGTARCNVTGITTPGTICQETFSWGLRNPFRVGFDPGSTSTRFFINDVGQDAWEEIDLAQAGADYGWNICEGTHATGTNSPCTAAPPGMVNPAFEYSHSDTGIFSGCGAITGGAFVPAGSWPSATYDGSYMFSDYNCGIIFQRTPTGTVSQFDTGLGGSSAVTLIFGPFGSAQALYYTTYAAGGQVRQIAYTGSANRAPTAVLATNPTAGPAPLTVNFDATGSSDPDAGDTLTYLWNFGDGASTSTSSPTTSHVYGSGTFTASLRVQDNHGAVSDPVAVLITANNTPPVPAIQSPTTSDRFAVGQGWMLVGSATDAEDGTLPPSALSWMVLLHHNTHTHPFLGPVTGNNIPFNAPAPEDLAATQTSYLEIRLTATDSAGASTTAVQNCQPHLVNVTLATSPSGLRIDVNGTSQFGPQTLVSWEGYVLNVNAPPQVDGGNGFVFSAWSDGGAQSHAITTPSSPATYTATFTASPVLLVDDLSLAEGNAGTRSAVFTVRLSNPSGSTVTVDWATNPGTATAGVDYLAGSGSLTFSGTQTQTLSVTINGDRVPEANETFFVNLSNNLGAPIAKGQAVGTIVNDDFPWADFDGNGLPDVLWQNQSTGLLVVWSMSGVTRTGFAVPNPAQVADLNWKIVGTGDFNNDGKTDILWQNQASGLLVVWYMDGVTRTGFDVLNPSQVTDLNWKVVATGDFNGDGKPDILWQRASDGLLVVWYMDGVTRTNFAVLNPGQVSDLNWKIVATGDFNGDGKPDILWQHVNDGPLVVWYMDGVTRTGFAALNPSQVTDLNWKIYAVADLNGDGKPDVLWQHQGDGFLVVWYMDGVTRTGFAALNPSQVTDPSWKIVGPK